MEDQLENYGSHPDKRPRIQEFKNEGHDTKNGESHM